MDHGSKYLLLDEKWWDIEKFSACLDNGSSIGYVRRFFVLQLSTMKMLKNLILVLPRASFFLFNSSISIFPSNSLPEDGTVVRRLFHLDPETGVLSTKVKLDREERSNYTLIVDVADLGSPPQQV